MKNIVLLSGGLDSTTCLALAIKKAGAENVLALSLYYGQAHEKELACAKEITEYYGVEWRTLDVAEIFTNSGCSLLSKNKAAIPEEEYADQLKKTGGKPVSTYVPFRNGLFLSVAASIAIGEGYEAVWYGAHKDDAAGNAYPDCSEEFITAMAHAIWEGSGRTCTLVAPFASSNKADIVNTGIRLLVPYELTWSCYEGGDLPCGKCGTCRDRIKAFEQNGLKDPLKYKE